MNNHSTVYGGLFVVVAIAIEVVVGMAAFRFAIMLEQNSLMGRAASIAAAMESKEISTLSGNESDIGTLLYQKLKEKIVRIKEANADVRFVYVTGQRNDNVFFYMDNEPVESPDYSPPGQIYEEATHKFTMVFTRGRASIDGPYTDRWGTWVSGIAPIFSSDTGKVTAVIGIDINAVSYFRRAFIVVLASVSLVGSLLLGMFILYARYAKEKEADRAKSEFVSLASHQLKTPLTIIKWYIDMLNAGYADDVLEKQKEYLGKIYTNTERMVELVDAFLNVSRLELGVFAIKKEPINLKDKIESILKNLDPKIKEKNLKVSKMYAKDNFVISADLKMIQIIFENLISNAIKYTPAGGNIHIIMQKKDDEILVSIADTGIGIPAGQQSKIFTKFFRADNVSAQKIDGTGLGLYLAKTLVEKAGGKIWFESPVFAKATVGKKEHKGTAFYVTLSTN